MSKAVAHQPSASNSWIVFLAAFFVVWTVRATLLFPVDKLIESETLRHIYGDAIRILLWIVPVFIYLKIVDKAEPFKYLKLTTPITAKALVISAILIILYFTTGQLLEYFVRHRSILGAVITSHELLIATLFILCAPVAEEILFRGFVLRKLTCRRSFWTANLITALLFVSIHWPNWLYTRGFQTGMLMDSALIFVLACFLGFLVKLTDSLWPAIAAHALNNLIAHFMR